MGVSYLTAFRIATGEDTVCAVKSENSKFYGCILDAKGMPLVSSSACFDSSEAAETSMRDIVTACKDAIEKEKQ